MEKLRVAVVFCSNLVYNVDTVLLQSIVPIDLAALKLLVMIYEKIHDKSVAQQQQVLVSVSRVTNYLVNLHHACSEMERFLRMYVYLHHLQSSNDTARLLELFVQGGFFSPRDGVCSLFRVWLCNHKGLASQDSAVSSAVIQWGGRNLALFCTRCNVYLREHQPVVHEIVVHEIGYCSIYIAIIPPHVGRVACGVSMWLMVGIVKLGLVYINFVEFQWFGALEFFMIGMSYVCIDMPSGWYFLWAFALKMSLCMDMIADKEIFVRWSMLLMILIHIFQMWNPPKWLIDSVKYWSAVCRPKYRLARNILVMVISFFLGIGDALYGVYARVARVNDQREALQAIEVEREKKLKLQDTSEWVEMTGRDWPHHSLDDAKTPPHMGVRSGSSADGNPSRHMRSSRWQTSVAANDEHREVSEHYGLRTRVHYGKPQPQPQPDRQVHDVVNPNAAFCSKRQRCRAPGGPCVSHFSVRDSE